MPDSLGEASARRIPSTIANALIVLRHAAPLGFRLTALDPRELLERDAERRTPRALPRDRRDRDAADERSPRTTDAITSSRRGARPRPRPGADGEKSVRPAKAGPHALQRTVIQREEGRPPRRQADQRQEWRRRCARAGSTQKTASGSATKARSHEVQEHSRTSCLRVFVADPRMHADSASGYAFSAAISA